MDDLSSHSLAGDADWSREMPVGYWDRGRKLLKSIRTYQKCEEKSDPFSWIVKKICVYRHLFWSIASGADIPLNAHISGGLIIPHPNGVVIHPASIIGPNCIIFQQVTLAITDAGTPVIGANVMIGAGAKVLGNVVIGDNVRIGANAVVLHSIEDGGVVAGVPATLISNQ